jgi:hypothetical protein
MAVRRRGLSAGKVANAVERDIDRGTMVSFFPGPRGAWYPVVNANAGE